MTNGIILRLTATFLMAAMSASVHAAAKEAVIGQIVFYRSLFALLPILIYAIWLGQFPKALKTQNPKLHLKRGFYGVPPMFFFFISLAYLPVANAIALGYLVPLFSLPLAAHFLKERLGQTIIIAALLGFLGVLTMLAPALAPSQVNEGMIIGTLAGLAYALNMGYIKIHTKSMTQTETPVSIAFYFALTCALVGGIT